MSKHPVEQEELMAYMDGELAFDRAATAAAHLERCRECQSVAGDLQSVTRRMMEWQVEASDDLRMTQAITTALEDRKRTQERPAVSVARSWRNTLRVPRFPRWIWKSGIAVAGLAALLVILTPDFLVSPVPKRNRRVAQMLTLKAVPHAGFPQDYGTGMGTVGRLETLQQEKEGARIVSKSGSQNFSDEMGGSTAPNGPMIVRTAALSLTTKEFDKARGGMEEILKRHGGYMGQLNVSAPSESGRSLTATLQVPSDQLDATLAELKKLGRVEGESQNGEEVTQRYVDLQARIVNARNTEAQLTDILRNRTGKLSDVLAVEEEISRVRGEIERMEAERKNLAHQVDFATLNATLTEEYEDQLQAVPVSTFTRIRNAAVEGYTSVTEGVISVVLFLFAYGPSILVWGGLVFFPVRAAWRRWRKAKAV
ncbi:MAG TPA: DUF4349 domain-containing protein [Terriglobales bacterium]|nr:DUF4349 domain-containing protein [Terriglobales bacterium]